MCARAETSLQPNRKMNRVDEKEPVENSPPPKNDKPKENLKKIFAQFSDTTTIYGFGRVKDASTIAGKLIWIVFSLCSVIFFVVHFIILINQFQNYPVSTSTNFDADFEWPAITLCNLLPFSVSRINRVQNHPNHAIASEVETSNYLNASDELEKLVQRFLPFDPTETKTLVQRAWNMSHFGHQVQDFILGCLFRGQHCSTANFTANYLPPFYQCFTFFPKPVKATRADNEFLDIMMFIESGAMSGWNNVSRANFSPAGKIFFHAIGGYPKVSKILDISAGTWTMIGLDFISRMRVDTPVSPCKSYGSKIEYSSPVGELHFNTTSDRDSCIDEALQREIVKRCSCVSEKLRRFSTPLSVPSCHRLTSAEVAFLNSNPNLAPFPTQLTRIRQAMECHASVFNSKFAKEDVSTICPEQCNAKDWKVRVSPHVWPKFDESVTALAAAYAKPAVERGMSADLFAGSGLLNDTTLHDPNQAAHRMQFVQSRFLRLNIRPVATTAQEIKESRSYPLESLLSEMGGIIGLYLGMSIVSIYELIHLVGCLVQALYYRRLQEHLKTRAIQETVVRALRVKKDQGPAVA